MVSRKKIIPHKSLKIGDIFTPEKWAEFAIAKFGIFEKWMAGATIFDPTMGVGNLLKALILYGLNKGHTLDELPVRSLFGNELNREYYTRALTTFHKKYGVDLSANMWNRDILDLPSRPFDILFGNPPWQNFVDLPQGYKTKIKPQFTKYDLTGDRRDLLLGGSRIDISALIIQASIKNFLKPYGEACFFMPLSLLLNDGANQHFRTFSIGDVHYAPNKIFDFNKEDVFNNVSTRYGLVAFKRDESPVFPIDYFILEGRTWTKSLAAPVQNTTSPLSIYKTSGEKPLAGFEPIKLPKSSAPRQGLNTCGANNLYFFKQYREISETKCIVDEKIELPSKFIYPLLKASNFQHQPLKPGAWVLIPHSSCGRPISQEELNRYPDLKQYLFTHRKRLAARKGTLISSWLKKGQWWALLGVGPYNYAPYKIVWEAYGKKLFQPMLVEGHWQANQSLQAFIPFQSKKEAQKALKQLQNPAIQEFLLSLKMEGTMNWAQPGKVKNLIDFIP